MGYARIVDLMVRTDSIILTVETDLVLADLRKVRFELLIREVEFEVWKKTNPDGTLKQFILLKTKEKYSEIKRTHDIAKNLVRTEFSW